MSKAPVLSVDEIVLKGSELESEPPPSAIPLHAHSGHGKISEGESVSSPASLRWYVTSRGSRILREDLPLHQM